MTENILQNVVLVQNGNIIAHFQDGKIIGAVNADNVQVHPAKEAGKVGDPQTILKDLKRLYPKCIFNWFAAPIEKPKVSPPNPGDVQPPFDSVPPAPTSTPSEVGRTVPGEPSSAAPDPAVIAPVEPPPAETTATGKHRKSK
jgi:hypothetical protein